MWKIKVSGFSPVGKLEENEMKLLIYLLFLLVLVATEADEPLRETNSLTFFSTRCK